MNKKDGFSYNLNSLNNKSKINYRPYSSNIKIKKNSLRVLSASNINNKNINIYKNSFILPTLNVSGSNIKIKKNIFSYSLPRKNKSKMEIEQLYEQNVNYKKTIQKLQLEINLMKNNLIEKQIALNSLNEEIEKILKENDEKIEFDKKTTTSFSSYERDRYIMIGKMKNKIREVEQGLKNEISNNEKNKKNIKFTKSKEIEVEKLILNEQKEKISLLIENSLEIKNKQEKELEENKIYNKNLKSQQKIINNFEKKIIKLNEEEEKLQNDIKKYEKKVDSTNYKIKIIKLRQITLKDQNKKLKDEKSEFNKKNKDENLEKLKTRLSSAINDYNYYKLKNEKTLKILDNIVIIDKNNKLVNKTSSSSENENENNEYNKYLNNSYNSINSEEYLNKIKNLYQVNYDREKELSKNISLYQQAIKKMNNGEKVNFTKIQNNILKIINKIKKDEINNINNKNKNKNESEDIMKKNLKLSPDNPYYINAEENDSIISNKFNNDQYAQFTYILFKNFEAKKINIEKAKNEIISPLIKYFESINKNENEKKDKEKKKEKKDIQDKQNIQEKLNIKFC